MNNKSRTNPINWNKRNYQFVADGIMHSCRLLDKQPVELTNAEKTNTSKEIRIQMGLPKYKEMAIMRIINTVCSNQTDAYFAKGPPGLVVHIRDRHYIRTLLVAEGFNQFYKEKENAKSKEKDND